MIRELFKKINYSFDWLLFGAVFFISVAGILTMNSFLPNGQAGAGGGVLFVRQIIWLVISIIVLFIASLVDWRFLRRTSSIVFLFVVCCFILLFLFVAGSVFKGAQSWFDLGAFAFQPVDFAKIVLVLLLAKYFSRRHIEIANVRHILTSGFYTFIIFMLVFLQPDFGSAIIIFLIWLSMVLVSGISKKHLLVVFLSGLLAFGGLWFFVFKDYQKARIISFINPLTDLSGSGYNAYQSTIAVGSGEIWGKGVGLGSQSKLKFLPEYETDFIFAAFSEEWGFVGVILIFGLYGVVFWRIISIAKNGATNFEILFGLGLSSIFLSHFIIHVGMNVGLLPVTGITMPFMSYGGSHLLAEFLGLGILMGQSSYARATNKEAAKNEIIGIAE
ncbi:MAG: rod shape-determining protein RodA [Candidatus Zambryskibacteria bacterium RIFCSPLOWO2_01_FULL_39_39]|uniref:Rod shape-determining protein RodA n=1 Tax=Candidatus Zambryskibacteria bacterium RIFCSPLOWO2_01_FULL_39_39 TaxID=1802758 RepID=A0A1G2TYU0_9BACT|nr:MAG: Rod shape-determining protein rodA [Parcubacteria group bacterium GW2011_GWA1_38_7]OHA87515.1 MAG: rod shape-determining protein RodA [Candidatus Zambryskibacteria bacterium RIFCSPHIGHO2_01_FULL_39_63]OHA95043.1 MAG: rod shape-determining protein RodA [Candidatus Zambryskibacteria bacterium RIFCSPHIGHO2_02_FULL_39_19]OHA98163.1 MAG: rod shape-determining protein RodA [Candidatus Zambryskibacteria bacterium RIFCSPHIGHO2_12_FULL_39_21]OHB02471.1 MAG: rod shape-determining protein RodA [Ca